jgi:hypothetical protein
MMDIISPCHLAHLEARARSALVAVVRRASLGMLGRMHNITGKFPLFLFLISACTFGPFNVSGGDSGGADDGTTSSATSLGGSGPIEDSTSTTSTTSTGSDDAESSGTTSTGAASSESTGEASSGSTGSGPDCVRDPVTWLCSCDGDPADPVQCGCFDDPIGWCSCPDAMAQHPCPRAGCIVDAMTWACSCDGVPAYPEACGCVAEATSCKCPGGVSGDPCPFPE